MKTTRTRPGTVALVGADGAGKTTMARRMEREAPVPVKYLYMGVSRQASNRMLPTTWLLWQLKRLAGNQEKGGPPDPSRRKGTGGSPLKRVLRQGKEGLRVSNLLAEEVYRQLLVTYYRLRGYTVLFDRHFYLDYYAHDVAPQDGARSFWRRLHGFFLEHVLPRPEMVVLLDAPAEVLFQRKPEGSVALLEQRRQEYWRLKEDFSQHNGPAFVVVDATRPPDEVAAQIGQAIAGNNIVQGIGSSALQPALSAEEASARQ